MLVEHRKIRSTIFPKPTEQFFSSKAEACFTTAAFGKSMVHFINCISVILTSHSFKLFQTLYDTESDSTESSLHLNCINGRGYHSHYYALASPTAVV